MKNSVIAIGLDAADPALIETWIAQGHLKNIARLRQQGTYGRLNNIDYYRAETPWTTFLTGCAPEKTGYWGPVKYDPTTYGVGEAGAYDYAEYPPFYALGKDYRVAVFDMPQSALSEKVNGVQALAWGAHSPMTPTHSLPAEFLADVVSKHGEHPGLHKDYADCRDIPALKRLYQVLKTGIERRAAICQDLLQQDKWNLLLTIFGETHTAGHYMWHLGQSDHALHEMVKGSSSADDKMLATFEDIDRAIGDIVAKAPEDAYIVVFAAHGMGSNVMDLPSMVFLPELMYRYSFPGKTAMAPGKVGTPIGAVNTIPDKKRAWIGEIWNLKTEWNPLLRFLRQKAPVRYYKRLDKFLNKIQQPHLISPDRLAEASDSLHWQPARWYSPLWSQMKAFALPSYSEGYIRINLKGREAQGIVAPAEYDAVCEELTQYLYRLTDARTGQPLVKEVMRTRQLATDSDPKLPDADLVVIWQEDSPTDVIDSPDFGRIGPVPYLRTGSHRARGFLVAQGPGIEPGSSLPTGHALDLAPTILDLMGAPIPEYFDGKPLLQRATAGSVA